MLLFKTFHESVQLSNVATFNAEELRDKFTAL